MRRSTNHQSRPGRGSLTFLVLLLLTLLACKKLKESFAEQGAEDTAEVATTGQYTPKVPDDWPAFLTQYPGSKVTVAGTSRITGGLSGSLSMETSDTPAQVFAYYGKLLSGYQLRQDMNVQGRHTKVFGDGAKGVTITVVRATGPTQVTLVVTGF